MTTVVVKIDDIDNTVTRSIVKSVTEQLVYSTEMPIIKDILYVQRGGISPMQQTNTPDEALKLTVDNYAEVEYSEAPDPAFFDMNKYQTEFPAIFNHPKLGIALTPMYNRMQLTIKFTYRSKGYDVLTSWLNALRRRLTLAQPFCYVDILYNFNIPTDITSYINKVYKLSEAVAPYGLTLKEFLQNNFSTNGLVVRQNLDDSQRSLAMNVKNVGVLGQFTDLPDIQETSKEPPISTLEFTFQIDYDRPGAILLEYQKYIHNQVIDLSNISKYHDRRFHGNNRDAPITFTQSVQKVTSNLHGHTCMKIPDPIVSDGWMPKINLPSVYTLAIIPVQLEVDNLTYLLDLNLLISYGVPEWLISLMKTYSSNLCTLFRWPIYIDCFEVDDFENSVALYIDNNFRLMSHVNLDLRKRNYVRISVLTDLSKVDWGNLLNDPTSLTNLLQFIDPCVSIATIGNGTRVNTNSLTDAINEIGNTDYKIVNGLAVLNANLIAYRNQQ